VTAGKREIESVMKESISLLLFICCALSFSTSIHSKTIERFFNNVEAAEVEQLNFLQQQLQESHSNSGSTFDLLRVRCPNNVDLMFSFLHVPKSGGSSIENTFQTLCDKPLRDVPKLKVQPQEIVSKKDQYWKSCRIPHAHSPFLSLKTHDSVNTCVYTFMIIRDPISQFISAFFTSKGRGRTNCTKQSAREHMNIITTDQQKCTAFKRGSITYNEFYDWVLHEPDNFWYTKRGLFSILSVNHISDRLGRIQLAKKRIKELDFVGVTERFDESMRLLSFTFGLNMKAHTTLANPNIHPSLNELPETVMNRLKLLLQDELEVWQYATLLFQERFTQFLSLSPQEASSEFHCGNTICMSDEARSPWYKHYCKRLCTRDLP